METGVAEELGQNLAIRPLHASCANLSSCSTRMPAAEIRNSTNPKNDTSAPAGWRAAHIVEGMEQVLWINQHAVGK